MTTSVWDDLASAVAAAPPPGSKDAWESVAARLDVNRSKPQVGDWVETAAFDARGGRDFVMIGNLRDLIYYRFSPDEAALLPLMDGTRTVGEICVSHLRESGELDVSGVVEVVDCLHSGGFLTERYIDVDKAVADAVAPKGPSAALSRFAKTLTIDWGGAERLTLWLHRHGLRYLFTRVGMVVAAVFAFGGVTAFVAVIERRQFSFTPQSVGFGFALLIVLNLVLVFIHELGHAILSVHYGRRVKSSGFRIYFGSPSFFIESSDVLMLPRRKQIAQSLAGPYFEFVATGVASLALWAWPDGSLAPVLYRFVVLNYFVLVMNLVPLLELDGYWVLSDLLKIPDLRPRSLAFLRRDMWSKLLLRQRFSGGDLALGLYGVIGIAFTIFSFVSAGYFWRRTFGSLFSKLWNAGPIGIALLFVLVGFLAGPLFRALFAMVAKVLRSLRDLWMRIRFRSQRSWRIEAAEMLDALPTFDDLSAEVLSDLAGRVDLRRVGEQTVVIRQGERADAMYIVRQGRLEVVESAPDSGDERVVHELGHGESFGELGLATGAVRNASVRALARCELFVIDKSSFDRLLADRARVPQLAPTLEALVALRALTPFANLTIEQLGAVRDQGEWRSVAPGERLITQGEPGREFFAIGSGRFEVSVDGVTTATLGPGDHFGEVALLTDVPRTATVSSVTPARVFALGRAGFDRLVADAVRQSRSHRSSPVEFNRE